MYRSVGREYSDKELERESLGTMVDMETVQRRRSEHAHAHSRVYLVRLAVESCDDTNVRIRRHINIRRDITTYTPIIYMKISTQNVQGSICSCHSSTLCLNSSSLSFRCLEQQVH